MTGVPALHSIDAKLTTWAEASNPFFAGYNSDWLALIPFVFLTGFLYLVGREVFLSNRAKSPAAAR